MHRFLLTLAICFLAISANAQDIKVSIQTGYGFYNMSSFSNITDDIYENLPFESKIISNYPPYIYYQPMFIFTINRLDIGVYYLFQTSGSRISSKDYSGEYLFDSKINSNSSGIILGYRIKKYENISIGLNVQVGYTFNTLEFHESLKLNEQILSEDENTLTSQNPYFKPNLDISYNWNRLSGSINLGYFKEFLRNNYSLEGARENEILVETKFTESDIWDGFRIGISFSYTILKNNE